MNFLIMSPFAPDAPRGNSVAASRILDGLRSRGHNAMIAAPDEIAEAGGKIGYLDGFRADLILILHAYHCAGAVKILKRCSDAPVFLSIRGTDANEMLDDREKSAPVLSSMQNADKIIVFAEDIRDGIIARTGLPGEKFEIVPNGLGIPCSDIDFRDRLSIPPEAFVFASLAGLREVKRPLFAPQCLSKMRQKHPNLLFVHAGPALEEKSAAEFLDFASGNDWILHVGVIRHPETDSFLRSADVFVSASRSEGMPHAVREAMFQGLPCLLSDIPGHRRIANEETSVFFNGEDDFIRKAFQLIENYDLRRKLGRKAAEIMKASLCESDEVGALVRLAEQNLKS